ncbi:MAG: hypothetical protein ACTSQJ_17585, partial [Promethearchaeota archaeon]
SSSASIQPKAGDEISVQVNNAFNQLYAKINNLKGDEFSKGLQDVADLILELKGFSVTLHNIRSWINNFKGRKDLLNEDEKKQLFEALESWKQRLL